MVPISSSIESTKHEFTAVNKLLNQLQFALGGGWDYEGGSFDRYLDDEHKVWLRIPFKTRSGNIDIEADNGAVIEFDRPFVLKHLYNEGTDPEGSVRLLGALFDQFQTPVDPDARVEQQWLDKAKELLAEVERAL
ncbi:YugN family protein [Paenibacillus protaetiae]|uniref:YugN-like family protein n=1 Tax=Paenibacillus protaetiae TaxID=2509456 RepID=A0A4P6ETP7_9BACL|nr:YugN family protein [Paenibacillus protaetiae]QAY65009.1 hypothetical protein ET464_00025 [Paenibacillus protaetiae]